METVLTTQKTVILFGHRGMVGASIHRLIKDVLPDLNVIVVPKSELDLRDRAATKEFIQTKNADSIVVAAAKVGGIKFNDAYPVDFIRDNFQIAMNIMEGAHSSGVERLLYLGSSCIYPKDTPQPITEEQLFTGPLEPTNEAYSLAKIAGVKLCEFYNRQYGTDFRALMPCNLYGVGDTYHIEHSHVIPALLLKMHKAKVHSRSEIQLWGSGLPEREFLFVDDLADACLKVMKLDKSTWIENAPNGLSYVNAGSGNNIKIRDLAKKISKVVGFDGEIKFDLNDLDGVTSKLLDSSRLKAMGWHANTSLDEGLAIAYADFLKQPVAQED